MEEHLDALELAMAAGAASRPGGFAHLLSCDHAALVTQRLQEYASGDVFAATGGRDVDLAEATRVLELGVRLARLGVRDVARSSAAATAAAAAAKRKKGARAGNKQAEAAEAAEDAAASNAASAVRLTERARLAAAAADGLRAARCDGHVGGRLLAATPPGPRLREAERERAALRWQALAHLPAAYFEATLPCLRPPTSSGGGGDVGREAADGAGTQQPPHAAWREVERFEDDAVTVFAAPLPAAEDPAPEPTPAEAAAAAPGSGTLVEEAGEGTADPPEPEPEPEPASVAGHSLYAQAGAFFTRHAHVAGEVAAAAAAAAPAKLSADTLLRRQLEERVRHRRLAREASRAEKKRHAPGAAAATATAAATYRISVVSPVLVAPKKVAARRTRVKLRASPDDNCNALPRSGGGVPQPAELQLLPEAPAAALRTSDAAPPTLLCYGGASGGVLDDVATLRAALARNDVDSLVGGFADERLREEVVEVPMAAMEEADVVCRLPKPPQLEGGTPPEAAVCVSAGDGDVEGGGGGGGGTKRKWLETLQEQMASSICKIVTGHRRFKVSKVGAILAEILGKQTAPAAAAPGGRQQEARMAEVYRRAKEDGSVPVTPQVVFAALVQHAHHSNLREDAGAHLRLRSEKNEIVITREGA